jgi:hypothetical protein
MVGGPSWASDGFGPDARPRAGRILGDDPELVLRRGLASFRISSMSNITPGMKFGFRQNPDSGLPSFTEVRGMSEVGDHVNMAMEHRPPPAIDDLLVRVRARSEGVEDEWEVIEAAAAQSRIKVETRWNPTERLLFIFARKEIAKRIFSHGVQDGLWRGEPLEFELSRLRGDQDVLNTFQAWARGTGRVTTHAFFGNNILEEDEVRRTRLSSVRVNLRLGGQELVVFISADGRINCADDSLDHAALYDLFHRLYAKLTPNRRLNEPF